MRSALPATKQAAGAPSAWSQPSQSTHARPRRWCDAGSPGRQCVTAAQKAGVEGMVRNNGSALTRARARNRHATVDSQDGCRYTIPNARGVAIGFQPVDDSVRIRDSHERVENRPPSGCRVRHCAGTTIRLRPAPRTMALPGSPGRRDEVCCPGNEAGRRRAIGVVAALSIYPPATTPMVRRWSAETPMRHGGPEGR